MKKHEAERFRASFLLSASMHSWYQGQTKDVSPTFVACCASIFINSPFLQGNFQYLLITAFPFAVYLSVFIKPNVRPMLKLGQNGGDRKMFDFFENKILFPVQTFLSKSMTLWNFQFRNFILFSNLHITTDGLESCSNYVFPGRFLLVPLQKAFWFDPVVRLAIIYPFPGKAPAACRTWSWNQGLKTYSRCKGCQT